MPVRPLHRLHLRLSATVALGIFLATPLMAERSQRPAESPPPSSEPPELPAEVRLHIPPSPPSQDRPDGSGLQAQLELLHEFLTLPPEQLQRIRHAVHLIERLSPEERESMRLRIARMRSEAPEVAGEAESYSRSLDPSAKAKFKRFWLSLPREERQQLKEQWAAIPDEDRDQWVDRCLRRIHEREGRLLEKMEMKSEFAGETGS